METFRTGLVFVPPFRAGSNQENGITRKYKVEYLNA